MTEATELREKATAYVDEMLQKPNRVWYAINVEDGGKSRDELIEMEFAGKLFWQTCHQEGAYGHNDVVALLRRGGVPLEVIEGVLIHGYGLGGDDYPAIAEGYAGKLSSEAQAILDRYVRECQQFDDALGYLRELGRRHPGKTMQDISLDELLTLCGKLHGAEINAL